MALKGFDVNKIIEKYKKQSDGDKKSIVQNIGLPKMIIIILAGVVLLMTSIPSSEKGGMGLSKKNRTGEVSDDEYDDSSADAAFKAMNNYVCREERKLEDVLQKVEGIGKVDVMITLSSSEEKMTLKDSDVSEERTEETDSGGGSRKKDNYTSKSENIMTGNNGNESPYVVRINSPDIEGVVVVAQGAGNGKKDTEIIEAVQALFEVESHKIKVMKME